MEHLDYLEDLGVTAIYLTPIFQSASNHRYHTYDYFAVDPLLGGDAALRELLDRAHDRGMRVVLDGVFNHTGRGFWPFHHILETGAASPYRDWFLLDAERLDGGRPLLAYPPPGTPRSAHGYEAWWGLPALPKLNTDQPRGPRVPPVGWPSTGCASGSTAGASTCRRRSTTRRSGRSSDAAAGRSGPMPTSSARSGGSRPSGCGGDRFDALMNYPLGEAILGFAGGPLLDMDVVRRHHSYAAKPATAGRPGIRGPGRWSSRRPTTRTSWRSSSTWSGRTTPRGCGRSWAATSRASGWRRSSR